MVDSHNAMIASILLAVVAVGVAGLYFTAQTSTYGGQQVIYSTGVPNAPYASSNTFSIFGKGSLSGLATTQQAAGKVGVTSIKVLNCPVCTSSGSCSFDAAFIGMPVTINTCDPSMNMGVFCDFAPSGSFASDGFFEVVETGAGMSLFGTILTFNIDATPATSTPEIGTENPAGDLGCTVPNCPVGAECLAPVGGPSVDLCTGALDSPTATVGVCVNLPLSGAETTTIANTGATLSYTVLLETA